MISQQILISVCILLIVALIAVISTEPDNRLQLVGVWTATAPYCATAKISSMALKINEPTVAGRLPTTGHLVITKDTTVLCNQSIALSGWSSYPCRYPNYTTSAQIEFEHDTLIPKNIQLCVANGLLTIDAKPLGTDSALADANGFISYGEFTRY